MHATYQSTSLPHVLYSSACIKRAAGSPDLRVLWMCPTPFQLSASLLCCSTSRHIPVRIVWNPKGSPKFFNTSLCTCHVLWPRQTLGISPVAIPWQCNSTISVGFHDVEHVAICMYVRVFEAESTKLYNRVKPDVFYRRLSTLIFRTKWHRTKAIIEKYQLFLNWY